MKIAYIFESLVNVGGTERILTFKMNYLADELDYEVYLVTWKQQGHKYAFPLSDKIRHIDIDVDFNNRYHRNPFLRLWANIKTRKTFTNKLQKVIDEIQPDILVGTTYKEPGAICQLRTKAKRVIESHCPKSLLLGVNNSLFVKKWDISITHYRYNVLRSALYAEKHCDCLVSLTNGDSSEWKTKAMKVVIPNVVSTKHSYLSDCTIKRVICAGRLNEQKGFDLIIEAWSRVASKHTDWQLAIFGDGELKDSLNQQINRSHLTDNTKIMPFSANIYKEYAQSSIFVLSSRYEGFGLVLAEAMSCGIPCISFDCHYGPSDIIKDGEDGLLVANGNVEALADSICWMIEHDEERKAMGRKARQNIERYSPEVVMAQWNKLFHQLYKANLAATHYH